MSEFPTVIATPNALLTRLRRASRMGERYKDEINEVGQRLVNYSLAAIWDDCVQAGLGDEAREVMFGRYL